MSTRMTAPGAGDAAALAEAIAELRRIPDLAEERFVAVGLQLADIVERVDEVTRLCAAASELLTAEEAQRSLADLREALHEISALLDEGAAHSGAQSLQEVIVSLRGATKLMERFRDRVGALRMLKLLTGIQVASLRGRYRFDTVGDDIGKLARSIHDKSGEMIGKTRLLQEELQRAVPVVAALEAKQKGFSATVREAIGDALTALDEMHSRCSAGVADVCGGSAGITHEIGEIVVGMQFHDLTRQQMEHCVAALQDAERVMAAPFGEGEVERVVRLQRAQLQNTSAEIAASVARIGCALDGVGRRTQSMAALTRDVLGLSREMEASVLGGLQERFSAVTAGFAEHAGAAATLSSTVLRVTSAMEEISGFLEDIEIIGADISLIALNAIIKAAQAGREGAAVTVIAQSVKEQAGSICAETANLIGTILAISARISSFRDEHAVAGEVSTTRSRDILATTSALLDGLLRRVHGVSATLADVDVREAALVADVAAARDGIRCRDLEQRLRERVLLPLAQLSGGEGPAAEGEGLAKVQERYTMQSERQVHELFAAGIPALAAPMPAGRDAVVYDNVELF